MNNMQCDELGRNMLITWNGDEDRALGVYRYCDCGTCQRAKPGGAVGYLTGSTPNGDGFSATLYSEERYADAFAAFGGER